jgi:hypothetical protein
VSLFLRTLQQSSKSIQNFPSQLEKALLPASKLGRELGGFSSGLSSCLTCWGVSAVLDGMRNNRNFQRSMLQMEMNGRLKPGEAAHLKTKILQIAGDSLQSPAAIQKGQRRI